MFGQSQAFEALYLTGQRDLTVIDIPSGPEVLCTKILKGHMKLASFQLVAIFTKLPTSLRVAGKVMACVPGILGKQVVTTAEGTLVLKRGCHHQGYQIESRRPSRDKARDRKTDTSGSGWAFYAWCPYQDREASLWESEV